MIDDEEELEVSANLKKLLVAEVDLIRDALLIIGVFADGGLKTGLRFLEDIDNNTPEKKDE